MNLKPILNFIPALLAFAAAVHAENWPQFRGPTRQGVSSETGLPLEWSATANVAWKVEIPGQSWSSPIVWGDRVFVTTVIEAGPQFKVLARNPLEEKIQASPAIS